MVKKVGYQWAQIGKFLERTPLNVRDKWKQLFSKKERTNRWKVEEILQLIECVQSQTGQLVFDLANKKAIIDQIQKQYEENMKSKKSANKAQKKAIQHTLKKHQLIEKPSEKPINWDKIAAQFPDKSPTDLKNKWFLLFQYKAKLTPTEKEQSLGLIKQLMEMKVQKQSQIDYSKITNGLSQKENKQLLLKLKSNFPKIKNLQELFSAVENQLNKKKY